MKIVWFTFILSGIVAINVAAQTGNSNDDTIASFQTMHVHFDKDIYLAGETIWFKAYLYNVNEISLAATNFYVAMYDEKGKLIRQKQYPVLSGSANGDFEVPDSLPGSRIRFRAFTKAMIQHDSNNIYERILDVYKKENNSTSGIAMERKPVQFFPEGGQIIASLQNYIGVTAIDANGNPAKIKGKLVETGQKKIYSDFLTNSMGLGQFIFAPVPGKNYSAIWIDEKGITHETALPPVKTYGIALHAEVVDKEVQYTLTRNITSDSVSLLHLLAQMGNYQVYKADLVLLKEMDYSTAGFPVDSLPAGLMQLTLFDKYWNKLQERNLFINEKEMYAVPVVRIDSVKHGAKEKSMIEIVLGDTLFTSLSVSVTDVDFNNTGGTNTITQDLLLKQQIKNPVFNMEPFLKAGNNEMINLFTLNQAWRKYDWKKLINSRTAKPELLDDYITVAALYDQKNMALPKDDALNLILHNGTTVGQMYNLKPAGATIFKKTGLIFFDSVKLAYQMDKNKKLTSFLKIYKDGDLTMPAITAAMPKEAIAIVKEVTPANDRYKPFINPLYNGGKDAQVLKEVIVKSKYRNPKIDRILQMDKQYTSGMFSGIARGYQLNLLDDTLGLNASSSLKNYIRYHFPGLETENGIFGKGQYGENMKRIFVPTVIYLDEVEIFYDPNGEFEMVNMSDVAYVKYIPGIVIGSNFKATAGAIYIYNKKGNEAKPSLSKGLPFVYIKGYNLPKEFAQPDKNESNAPDLRSTLYWNPNIIMDKANNSFKIEYYNNDVSKKLLLKIEGINAAGKLIHIERVLE